MVCGSYGNLKRFSLMSFEASRQLQMSILIIQFLTFLHQYQLKFEVTLHQIWFPDPLKATEIA